VLDARAAAEQVARTQGGVTRGHTGVTPSLFSLRHSVPSALARPGRAGEWVTSPQAEGKHSLGSAAPQPRDHPADTDWDRLACL
jgi:hypothetical protein